MVTSSWPDPAVPVTVAFRPRLVMTLISISRTSPANDVGIVMVALLSEPPALVSSMSPSAIATGDPPPAPL